MSSTSKLCCCKSIFFSFLLLAGGCLEQGELYERLSAVHENTTPLPDYISPKNNFRISGPVFSSSLQNIHLFSQ